MGEVFNCFQDVGNQYDVHAVKVVNGSGITIRHVPREMAQYFHEKLQVGRLVTVEVIGKRENKRRCGLEVPGLFMIF